MNSYLEQAKACAVAIRAHDYFAHIWEEVEHQKPLEDCTKEELLKPFQDMWERLPDNMGIRRPPFFDICHLAEEYVFGEEDAGSLE